MKIIMNTLNSANSASFSKLLKSEESLLTSNLLKILFVFATALLLQTAFIQTAHGQESSPTASESNESATQTSVVTAPPVETPTHAAQGVRLSVIVPPILLKANFDNGNTLSNDQPEKADRGFGLSAGYAMLPVEGFGFIGEASLIRFQNKGIKDLDLARVSVNGAYVIDQYLYIKAGVNTSKFFGGNKELEKFEPELGYQYGFGVQLTQNYGLDLGFSQMNQKRRTDGINAKIRQYGLEIGAHATF